MSAVTITQPSTGSTQADNDRKLEALCQLIELGQGGFTLALVEFDLPRLQNLVLGKLSERLAFNILTIKLTPSPSDAPRAYNVLDQMGDLVKLASPKKPPEALIVTGLESLFPQ